MIKKDHFTCYFCQEESNYAINDTMAFHVVHTTLGDVEVCAQCLPRVQDWETIKDIEEAKLNW